jgi:phosphate transport system substrate-binding protein
MAVCKCAHSVYNLYIYGGNPYIPRLNVSPLGDIPVKQPITTPGLSPRRTVAVVLLITAITASLLGSGCIDSTNNNHETEGTSASPLELQVAGSTTVLPIVEECARVFMEQRPGDKVYPMGGGSSHGIKSVADGTVDIGTASRDMKSSEEEAYPDLVMHGVAKDGVAVVVHHESQVSDLTIEQLQDIYAGRITNWQEVGGEDSEITEVSNDGIIRRIVKFFNCGEDSGIMVVSREEGSGTRDCFEQMVMKPMGEEITDHAIIQDSNGKIRTTVAGNKAGIGFISIGYVDSSVKAVALDGVQPTVETVRSGEYAISRTLLMITDGEPDDDEQAFLDFVLSEEGQRIVTDVHFIPVNI